LHPKAVKQRFDSALEAMALLNALLCLPGGTRKGREEEEQQQQRRKRNQQQEEKHMQTQTVREKFDTPQQTAAALYSRASNRIVVHCSPPH
jgi:hypothetical protein